MEKVRLTLSFRHSLLIGGQSSVLLANAATAREPGGAPLVPASALKGALRIAFERFLRGLGEPVCHPDRPDYACRPDRPCLSCQLFGMQGKEGRLRFQDARLHGEVRRWFTEEERPRIEPGRPTGQGYALRPGVAIGRSRKVAEEKLLFDAEVVASLFGHNGGSSPLTFVAEIEVWGPLAGPEWERLQGAVQSLSAIGGDKTQGLGHLEARLEPLPGSAVGAPVRGSDVDLILVPTEYLRVSGIKSTNNFMESLEYLPGGAVRGALARSFAQARGGWGDEAVRRAFLQAPVRFSDFHPTARGFEVPLKPIPLSTRTCKAYPGFQRRAREAEAQESHGARDILVATTVVKLLREQGLPVALEDRYAAPGCDAALKALEGFYVLPGSNGQASQEVPRRTTTKTAINRARFASEEGQLYSYEVLDPQLECAEELSGERRRLRFFSLTLTSDLALPPGEEVADWLTGQVGSALGLRDRGLQLEKAIARVGIRGGFNEALGLQKETMPVVIRGSAFVFSCEPNGGEEEAALWGNLVSLLRNGLGRKREEGFGRLSFCDPFHLERLTQS